MSAGTACVRGRLSDGAVKVNIPYLCAEAYRGRARLIESDLDDSRQVCERRCGIRRSPCSNWRRDRADPCAPFCRGCATRCQRQGSSRKGSTSMMASRSWGACAALEDRIEAVRAAAAELSEKKVTGSALCCSSADAPRCFCAGAVLRACVSSLHPRRCRPPACAA